MSDDIVTRLREQHCFDDAGCNTMAQDAADEIERLREEVIKAYTGFNYWEERCIRAEECLDFMFRRKRRWRLW